MQHTHNRPRADRSAAQGANRSPTGTAASAAKGANRSPPAQAGQPGRQRDRANSASAPLTDDELAQGYRKL